MIYKTTKQFSRGPEIIMESFREYNEAEHYIQNKLSEDAQYKVEATYRIYEFDEIIKEFTHNDIKIASASQAGSSGASSAGQSGAKKEVFMPSPFSMQPQPGGLPKSSFIEVDDDSSEKK